MYLKSINLRSFRNYIDQQVEFKEEKTILVGNNAQGKSNLLEAVELLSTLKSHRTQSDRELVNDKATESQILATVERLYTTHELGLVLRKQGRRTVNLNHEPVRRQIDFLGSLNTVQFSSLDSQLVRGAPEYRRHWVDNLLVQLEPIYAHILHQYQQVLRQRNALLKAENIDIAQLVLWDEQLASAGSRVTRRRARVLGLLAPVAQSWHASISGNQEVLEIKYTPNVSFSLDEPAHVKQAFLDKIEQRRIAEQQLKTTVVGPHRDEIEFTINEVSAKSFASQGQQRTLVLALKLAELKLIEEVVKQAPILLLDDVLAELDQSRQNHLLEVIQARFQTLITTTHLNSFESKWLKGSQILAVEGGVIKADSVF